MVLFHFRVHVDNLDISKLVAFIRSMSVALVIVKEMGSRPHIHCIIIPNKTVSTFRQQFLTKFPMCKGNRCYSLEQVKDEEAMKAYVCKGEKDKKPEILYSNIPADEYHTKYWDVNSKLSKHETVTKKKTISWIQEVKQLFNEENEWDVYTIQQYCNIWKASDIERKSYDEAREKLFGFILKKLGKAVKVIDDNIVTRIYKGILNSYIQEGNNSFSFNKYYFSKLNLDF